jgi:hypothetical protein
VGWQRFYDLGGAGDVEVVSYVGGAGAGASIDESTGKLLKYRSFVRPGHVEGDGVGSVREAVINHLWLDKGGFDLEFSVNLRNWVTEGVEQPRVVALRVEGIDGIEVRAAGFADDLGAGEADGEGSDVVVAVVGVAPVLNGDGEYGARGRARDEDADVSVPGLEGSQVGLGRAVSVPRVIKREGC